MIPNEIKAIAHGIAEDEAIKHHFPALRFIPVVTDHECEITVNHDMGQTVWGISTQLCKIDLDDTLEIWKGRTKGRGTKPITKIEYSDPRFIDKIINTIMELLKGQEYETYLRDILKL